MTEQPINHTPFAGLFMADAIANSPEVHDLRDQATELQRRIDIADPLIQEVLIDIWSAPNWGDIASASEAEHKLKTALKTLRGDSEFQDSRLQQAQARLDGARKRLQAAQQQFETDFDQILFHMEALEALYILEGEVSQMNTARIKPGAFRVYDTVENRYLEDGERDDSRESPNSRRGPNRFLSLGPDGSLSFLMDYDCGRMDDSDAEALAPGRYLVERWTGLRDISPEKKPIYVGDAVYFEKIDIGNEFERMDYRKKNPGITDDELDRVMPRIIYHLIRGIKEGRGDFDTFCLSDNDAMFMGHKKFRKYSYSFRVIGNVHEPFADLAARVPEYVDHLAGAFHDAAKVGEGVERG